MRRYCEYLDDIDPSDLYPEPWPSEDELREMQAEMEHDERAQWEYIDSQVEFTF